jgi:hypothetical protein
VLAFALVGCGRAGFDPVATARPDSSPDPCETPGVCDVVVTALADCSTGPRSGDDVCTAAGWGRALESRGYYWFQCAGPIESRAQLDCPSGWPDHDLACADWCIADDCVGVAYCDQGVSQVGEKSGIGSVTFDPQERGPTCGGYNPGWLIRVRCVRP